MIPLIVSKASKPVSSLILGFLPAAVVLPDGDLLVLLARSPDRLRKASRRRDLRQGFGVFAAFPQRKS